MKLDELTKFSLSLSIIPIVPAILVYKYFSLSHAMIVLIVFWILSLFTLINKNFAKNLKSILNKIGAWLGKYIADIALFIIYIFAVIPTKCIMLLAKRDRLRIRTNNNNSYWLEYKQTKTDYELEY